MKTLEEIKIEREEKVIDILRAVHVHGVDGDFDGCDGLDKDPQSLSVQTATKKITKILDHAIQSAVEEREKEIIEKLKSKIEYKQELEWLEKNDLQSLYNTGFVVGLMEFFLELSKKEE